MNNVTNENLGSRDRGGGFGVREWHVGESHILGEGGSSCKGCA